MSSAPTDPHSYPAVQWSANGTSVLFLPAGTYQIVPATITAGYFELVRVPGE